MTTAIERLEALLDEKDRKIETLDDDIQRLKCNLRNAEAGWCLPVRLPLEQSLPVPRLELWYNPLGTTPERAWWRYEVIYRMVYRHLVGDIIALPFGRTEISGSDRAPMTDGRLQLPFRDGAHICHDMAHLHMPGFAIHGDHVDDLTAFAGKPHERRP